MRFDATELTIEELALQAEVREYLDKRLTPGTYSLGLGMAGAVDPVFSRDLGRRGWLGMSLPKEYGGGGRSAVDRLVVVDDPDGFHAVGLQALGLQGSGIVIVNTVRPGTLSQVIVPWCCCTKVCASVSPRPEPPSRPDTSG